jgi:tagaturonate reductase
VAGACALRRPVATNRIQAAALSFPILQFGTSRFLQAHVDLFVSEARAAGQDAGPIAVAQTTSSPDSRRRLAFFDSGRPYRVRVQGLARGATIDETVEVSSIRRGVDANGDWAALERLFVDDARWIISNTGDRGYELADGDAPDGAVPRSFPAKLTKLLFARFRVGRAPLTLFPCELIVGNGDKLKALALDVARGWRLGEAFADWLANECLWVNSLVDRIVSEPLEPAGALAEPYALWAVANQPGLRMPCVHPAIVLTDDLARYERLKLFVLNLGHTWLAEGWAARGGDRTITVRAVLADAAVLADLNDLYDREVLPVFNGIGLGEAARAYRDSVIERFRNPFLNHFLADIFTNHEAKKARRFGGIIALSRESRLDARQPRLAAALGRAALEGRDRQ